MKHIPAIALAILVLGSAALAVMPSYLVSAMRSQTQYDMELSHALSNWAPILVVINRGIGGSLASMIWRRKNARLWNKVILAIGVAVLVFAAYSTRSYLAEGMFTALPEVVRVAASDATSLSATGVRTLLKHAGEAAAYPFPIIGYPPIVNDRLGDEPFVVTY